MAQQEHAKSQFTPVNGYLWTPPENTVDSFSKDDTTAPVTEWQNKLPPLQARTPPASPTNNSLPSIASATGFSTQDSPLFPERRTDRARSQTPLFETDRSQSPQRAQSAPSSGDDGAAGSMSDLRSHLPAINTIAASALTDKPSSSEIFPAILGVRTPRDALSYWYSRLGELADMRKATSKLPSPKTSSSPERDWLSKSQLRRVSKPTGISKSRTVPKSVSRPKAPTAASHPVEKASPPRRRTPKVRTYSDFVDSAFPQQQQQVKHKRAPPSKKVESDNVSWSELPNFAPSTSTLESNAKSLKATWHGNPVDLSSDPDRIHLHPQELAVAATLRLSCAQYLSNKRKIFQGRLQALKDGKNFTKTAAQGACSIDVNKASQLWEAFERVGWFKESWFEQYL